MSEKTELKTRWVHPINFNVPEVRLIQEKNNNQKLRYPEKTEDHTKHDLFYQFIVKHNKTGICRITARNDTDDSVVKDHVLSDFYKITQRAGRRNSCHSGPMTFLVNKPTISVHSLFDIGHKHNPDKWTIVDRRLIVWQPNEVLISARMFNTIFLEKWCIDNYPDKYFTGYKRQGIIVDAGEKQGYRLIDKLTDML